MWQEVQGLPARQHASALPVGALKATDPIVCLSKNAQTQPSLRGGDLEPLARALLRETLLSPSTSGTGGPRWDDVVGLEGAKALLLEAVVAPLRHPELFTGVLAAGWRGALLFGPPGTGKTLLARAAAARCGASFFAVSAATLASKWRGEPERMARALFRLARHHAPAVVFIDEADALLGARGGGGGGDGEGSGGGESEASTRLKTELLVQLDGITTAGGGGGNQDEQQQQQRVFVLVSGPSGVGATVALLLSTVVLTLPSACLDLAASFKPQQPTKRPRPTAPGRSTRRFCGASRSASLCRRPTRPRGARC